MASTKRFHAQICQFLKTKSSFNIIYSTSSTPLQQSSRLVILDSSFNPPHRGHLSLIDKFLTLFKEDEVSVLLLLSVKNADKLTPAPASFEDRLDMICLLADHIEKIYNVSVSVGLTNHAKFVDKSTVVREWSNETLGLNELKFTFLVGYDTLIRIFDPKYYVPGTISDELSDFMKLNDFFCLTRGGDHDVQEKYLQDISDGKTDLPNEWAEKIYLVEGDDRYLHISSSDIRKHTALQNDEWDQDVIPSIKEYIKKENLY